MLDIKMIRERPDFVRERLASRGAGDEAKVDEVLALDENRRKYLTEVEQLKAQRNRISKEIGALMAQKKSEEAEARKKEVQDFGERMKALDKQVAETEAARDAILIRLPNLPHPSVPLGKSSADNQEVRLWGDKPKFSFKPKSHVELCQSFPCVTPRRPREIIVRDGHESLCLFEHGDQLIVCGHVLGLTSKLSHTRPATLENRMGPVPRVGSGAWFGGPSFMLITTGK